MRWVGDGIGRSIRPGQSIRPPAKLAPAVFQAAAEGEQEMISAVQNGAHILAEYTRAVARRLEAEAPEVRLLGGLFQHHPEYAEFYIDFTADLLPGAKIGVLMASARRTEKPLHPTNLHVNQALFPRDTIQSRLPDPEWLERWLDEQIRFDDGWEKKVVERILHNLSILFERTFNTAQELNRYRKEVVARLQADQSSAEQPA